MHPDLALLLGGGAAAGAVLSAVLAVVPPPGRPRSAPRDCLVLFTLAGAAAGSAMASGVGHPPLVPVLGVDAFLAGIALAALAAAWLRSLIHPLQTWRAYLRPVVLLAVASFSLLLSLPLLIFNLPGAALGGGLAGGIGAWCARAVYDRMSNVCWGLFFAATAGVAVGAVLVIPLSVFFSAAIQSLHTLVHG
ncbi:hypothetical protein J0910_18325 [Nocardiopsis sp. CNT-189]|uniref:hypothetical protein n=1 Tax=Nocardiopsis oceanisediminis TaxID=2816862 RepID=UPI003B34D815